MKLPNPEQLIVDESKIVDYLLSESHRDGRHKAQFFSRFGFSVSNWQRLADALSEHARMHEIAKTEDSPFGTRYLVEGTMKSPDGRNPTIRSIWFVRTGETVTRLASAYPLKRKAR